MKKIVLTCVLVFSACCVTLFAQKDKKEKEDSIKMRFCAVLFAEKVAKAYDKGQGA